MNALDELARACFRTPKDLKRQRLSVVSAKFDRPDEYEVSYHLKFIFTFFRQKNEDG